MPYSYTVQSLTPNSITIQFNTGRRYSPSGQRIVARLDEQTARVYFQDLDRFIYGELDKAFPNGENASYLPAFLMREYDHGNYHWPDGFDASTLRWMNPPPVLRSLS